MGIDDLNLGQVASVFFGDTAPTNPYLDWWDTSALPHVKKVYRFDLGVWVLANPNAGQGFGIFENNETNTTPINIPQATHNITKISSIEIREYNPMPDDNYSNVPDSYNITWKIESDLTVVVYNPLAKLIQVVIAGNI